MRYYFIEDADQLAEFLDHLKQSETIAFDTEFVSETSYRPDLCLIQAATREAVAVIDPKAIHDVSEFWDCLTKPETTVIVHAAREEFRFCHRESGKRPGILFDVQVAAGMVGIEFPAAYSNLLQKVLKKTVGKGETRTDWRRRPLTDRQIEYAQKDVLYLHDLYDWCVEKLTKRERLDWFFDEMDLQQEKFEEQDSETAWTRLSGLNSLKQGELSIAKELWFWREREAERRNSPARRVLRDDLLIELAKRKSSDVKRIRSIRGLDRRDISSQLPAIAKVIEESVSLPPPIMPPSPARHQNQQINLLAQFLNAVLAGICRSNDIASAIVGNSTDIKQFIAYELGLNSGQETPALCRGWRANMVGEKLRDVLHGKTALRIANPRSENPIQFTS